MEFQIIAGDLCLDFINTVDHRASDRQQELLPTYSDLVDWAAQAGAISSGQRGDLVREAAAHPKAAAAVLRHAVEFRECMYRVIEDGLQKRHRAPDDLKLLNGSLAEALSHLELKAGKTGFRLTWNSSPLRLDSVLWPIVRSASDLLTSPDLANIHECDSETCRWLFVDRSKNHRRRWCDMRVCGNRAKARDFYRRQKQAS